MVMLKPKFLFLSVREAADALSVTEGRIRQILRAGDLRGEKLGEHAWAIPAGEIERYQKVRRGPGRRSAIA